MGVPCPNCGRLYTWDGERCCNRYCRLGAGCPAEPVLPRRSGEPADAEVVADLTREVPLARYCLIGGRIYTWGLLRQPGGGGVWVPLGMLIEDNVLARVAPGALCRAGVRAFRSAEEAAAWGREHAATTFQSAPAAASDVGR